MCRIHRGVRTGVYVWRVVLLYYISHRYMVSIDACLRYKKDGMFLWLSYDFNPHDKYISRLLKRIVVYVVYTLKTRSHESALPNLIFLHTYVKKVSPKIFVVDAGIIVITPPTSVSPSSVASCFEPQDIIRILWCNINNK